MTKKKTIIAIWSCQIYFNGLGQYVSRVTTEEKKIIPFNYVDYFQNIIDIP